MPSMSYCIFQNIVIELYQVLEKLEEIAGSTDEELQDFLSENEYKAFLKFKKQIQKINNLI